MTSGLQNVEFTGWLDHRDLTGLLGNADVGLCAYARDAVQSLPNKPFEYMAHGLALLSSLRGELETMVLDNRLGLQYNAGDPAMLAERMQWLAEHPEERKDMGGRARRLFEERFSSEVISPGLAKHIERIALAGKTIVNHVEARA